MSIKNSMLYALVWTLFHIIDALSWFSEQLYKVKRTLKERLNDWLEQE